MALHICDKKLTGLLIALLSNFIITSAFSNIIWSIGKQDNSASEFALAPDGYADFLKHDFGWEDRSFVIGISDEKKDWPFVLPGPLDAWGGTSSTAGIRTHVLNIFFRLEHITTKNDSFKLIIDLLDVAAENPPFFKVLVNGRSWKFKLPPGKNSKEPGGDLKEPLKHVIEITLPKHLIRNGFNEIRLTNLEGSWIVFDDIRMEGPESVRSVLPVKSAFLCRVEPANYQLDEKTQPLLVDILHVRDNPLLMVKIDGREVFREKPENGRSVFEVPMPAVSTPRKTSYEIYIDGSLTEKGDVQQSPQKVITPAEYVDTHIGSAHSRWMIAPGPWMPFSMVKLSPDNQNPGWQAGYEPAFESIGTFSHVHEWTMAGLGFMPVNGALKTRIGDQSELYRDTTGYRSLIDKSTERTGLGDYSVLLSDYHIKAELTATTRCGFQRYHFPREKDGRVMIDLKVPAEYDYEILDASLRQIDDYAIEGYSVQQTKNVWSKDADQDYTLHFRIEFDKPIKRFGIWVNDRLYPEGSKRAAYPERMGCYAEFDTGKDSVVQVRTGISYVDIEGARKNLQKEIKDSLGWSFEAVRAFNLHTWNELLSRVSITTKNRREKIRFYTNLYRSFCRNIFSDVDGRWVDATEKIQQGGKDHVALGCDAFWNTFWNLNQVWNLVAPEWSGRWVRSQLGMYNANGWLAKGPGGMEYIPVMVAEHEVPLLVSAYQMGVRDYDVGNMYEAIKKTVTSLPEHVGNGYAGNRDLAAFLQYHYVPADKGRFSNTLEYAYDNWTVAQLAKVLNKTEDYAVFSERGSWWKNAIDEEMGYARMRNSDGSWVTPFDPYKSGANRQYVEGNAWQLTYFVPQDVPALMHAIGRDRFLSRLTEGFKTSETWRYNAPGDQYWDFPVVQGNQQSMHFAFLFNWAGEPWKTQRWSRSIIDRYYGYGAADAYLGDEDQGQMSAWFVMAAMGLFQMDGGANAEPIYEIASPLFEKILVDLKGLYGRGNQFVIEAKNASWKNKYVQKATLNGRPLHSFKFPASELLKGGSLVLEMGDIPNKNWGVEK